MDDSKTFKNDTVAEWLRREIRNLLEFLRAGSSPVGVVNFLHLFMTIVSSAFIITYTSVNR